MAETKTIRAGVIGAGRIGRLHAEHLAHRIEGAELVAITDIQTESAAECARKLKISKVYHDNRALLDDPELDAVVICSSTDTHAGLIEDAARAGKHIFCEKPIDQSLERIDKALETVRKAGVKFQVGFNRRFDPNFSCIEQSVRQGNLGTPHIIRITSRDPGPPPISYIKVSGGMFLDMSIHDFDMARFLAGDEVESVYALGGVRVDKAIGDAGDIDTAIITLKFRNGILATIDNCRQAVYGYDQRVEVFGSEGVIWAENSTPNRTTLGNTQGMHSPLPLNFFMDRYIDSYIIEMQAFIRAILEDTEPPVGGADGRAPVAIALAAQRSLKEGRPLILE